MDKEGALNVQVGGTHYNMPIQPIEYIIANKLDFTSGNIVKYASRHMRKNGAEDVKKIIHYALFLLQFDYGYDEERINNFLRTLIKEKE